MSIERPYRLLSAICSALAGVNGYGALRAAAAAAVLTMLLVPAAAAQVEIVAPKDGTISTLRSQAVTVRSLPNSSIDLYINGTLARTGQVRVDGIVDFLNVTVPAGDVRIDVAAAGAAVLSSAERSRMIHVLGPPAKITIGMDKYALMADGISELTGAVRVTDEWGYALEKGTVTIGADSGTIIAEDIDPTTLGTQIALQDSVATFGYRAGKNAGTGLITVRMNELQTSTEVDLNTTREPFTLIGMASGTGGYSSRRLHNSIAFPDGAFDSGFVSDGRVALYARGTVANDYLLTASFDSDRRNRNRFFRDLDPYYLYSIYGDNSMLYYDAQSTRNLYAKIEKNQSYLLVGDYNTELTRQEFTLYNRTFHGGKLVLKNKDWNVTGFGTFTDRQVVQMELRGTGLSGFYNLGYTRVTPGSEKIRIETRDRFHSEVVLRQVDRYRFTDYEIDYEQGTVYFKQPVPAIDQFGNPTYIVVAFEAITDAANTYILGGRVENSMVDGLTFGLTGVTEEQQPQNYMLLGGDVKYNYNNRIQLGGEIGRSSIQGSPGTAYKVESSVTPFSELTLKGYYRKVEAGFFNITQSGSQRELGTEKLGGGATLQPVAGTKLSGDYYQTKQNVRTGETWIKSTTGMVEQEITSQVSVNAGIEDVLYQGPNFDTTRGRLDNHSTLLRAGLATDVTDRLKVSAFHEQNIGPDEDITKPDGTSIVADYRLSSVVALTGSQKFYDDGGRLSTIGVNTTPMEGTTLYGKYELGNVISEYRNMLSIGLRNTWKLPYDLTANIGYERAKSLIQRLVETPTQDHTAYSGSLEYLPKEPIKLAVKGEYGEDNISTKTNIDFGGDYRLMTSLGVFTKFRRTVDRARRGPGFQTRHHLITGLAFRPIDVNWFNCIGKYEWKTDDNKYLNPFHDVRNQIVSLHAYLEPIERWESGVKYAFKFSTDMEPLLRSISHTHFYLFHSKYNLTTWLDVGGEVRLLRQTEARDMMTGYSAEIGITTIKNIRVAGGYNFKGYRELDLIDYALWSRGPYVRLDMKFSEELLGLFDGEPEKK